MESENLTMSNSLDAGSVTLNGRRSSRNLWWTNLVLAAGTLLFMMALSELVLRWLPLPIVERIKAQQAVRQEIDEVHPKGLYTIREDGLWTLTPSFTGRFTKSDFDIALQTNSDGIRNEEIGTKASDTYRILGLGDSFAFGWGVENEESFLKVLERTLNEEGRRKKEEGGKSIANEVNPSSSIFPPPSSFSMRRFEVINAGIPGYGTYEALELLKTVGLGYEPDLVILAFYEGNDYRNNGAAPRKRTIQDGYLSDVREGEPSKVMKFLTTHSVLANLIGVKVSNISTKKAFKENVKKTKNFMLEIKNLLDERNIPFVFVLVPDQDAAFYDRNPLLRAYDKLISGMNLFEAREEMELFCHRNGILFYQLSPLFENSLMSIDLRLNDTHFNPKGHAIATGEIVEFLKREELV